MKLFKVKVVHYPPKMLHMSLITCLLSHTECTATSAKYKHKVHQTGFTLSQKCGLFEYSQWANSGVELRPSRPVSKINFKMKFRVYFIIQKLNNVRHIEAMVFFIHSKNGHFSGKCPFSDDSKTPLTPHYAITPSFYLLRSKKDFPFLFSTSS